MFIFSSSNRRERSGTDQVHQLFSRSFGINLESKILTLVFHAHHVGVGSAGHALTGVQVEELVELRGGQSVTHLQLLHNEHLPREWLLPYTWSFYILPRDSRRCHNRVRLMLETDLERQVEG